MSFDNNKMEDDNLMSLEQIDRESPEMWSEQSKLVKCLGVKFVSHPFSSSL